MPLTAPTFFDTVTTATDMFAALAAITAG